MSYTKGEWFFDKGEIIAIPSQTKICAHVSGATPEEAKANAKLITAAPDMLEALKMALDKAEQGNAFWNTDIQQMREAIAKTEGNL